MKARQRDDVASLNLPTSQGYLNFGDRWHEARWLRGETRDGFNMEVFLDGNWVKVYSMDFVFGVSNC